MKYIRFKTDKSGIPWLLTKAFHHFFFILCDNKTISRPFFFSSFFSVPPQTVREKAPKADKEPTGNRRWYSTSSRINDSKRKQVLFAAIKDADVLTSSFSYSHTKSCLSLLLRQPFDRALPTSTFKANVSEWCNACWNTERDQHKRLLSFLYLRG